MKNLNLIILIFSLFISTNAFAGPTLTTGYEFKSISPDVCRSRAISLLKEYAPDLEISTTSSGNILAEDYYMTVMVVCVTNAVIISAAGGNSNMQNNLIRILRSQIQ